MTKHLHAEIEKLKKKILGLSAVVEESVQMAVRSVIKRDAALAGKVVENDYDIDMAEVELEEECLKILALHQPVAIDLRFIIAVLKINNDLERIGDEAVNIAERGLTLASRPGTTIPFDIIAIVEKVEAMLKLSLDSLVRMDSGTARNVCLMDDEVDILYHEVFDIIKMALGDDPDRRENLIHYLGIARHLERIADHATNIAEDVIYMIEGIIIRHQGKILKKTEKE
jgi:phosphate transport system protein